MRPKRDQVYSVWAAIIQRCTNPKNKQFKDYGGGGITVCDRWRHSFTGRWMAAIYHNGKFHNLGHFDSADDAQAAYAEAAREFFGKFARLA